MDERQLLHPIEDSESRFKQLRTVPIFTVHLLATLALEITAIVYAILHPEPNGKCREYFILIYLHVAFWFLTLVSLHLNLCISFLLRVLFSL